MTSQKRTASKPCQRPLTIDQVLAWAEAHRERTGYWPNWKSGRVYLAPFETWRGLNKALREGLRGLPGGSSLAKLLPKRGEKLDHRFHPRLTIEGILAWADAHRKRTGQWPTVASGPVYESPSQTWNALNTNLKMGYRGLPGGISLAQLLVERRGARSPCSLPALTIPQILTWADVFHKRTGKWPGVRSGIVEGSGENWKGIENVLRDGGRGLSGGPPWQDCCFKSAVCAIGRACPR